MEGENCGGGERMVRALVDFVLKKCKIRVIKYVAKELDTKPQIIIFYYSILGTRCC